MDRLQSENAELRDKIVVLELPNNKELEKENACVADEWSTWFEE